MKFPEKTEKALLVHERPFHFMVLLTKSVCQPSGGYPPSLSLPRLLFRTLIRKKEPERLETMWQAQRGLSRSERLLL